MSPWFQSDPHRAPDSDFEPGELYHLCVGNEGRLLDFRRTPVRIERLCDETGLATLQILAFEDQGALWDLPFEDIGRCQFKKGSGRSSAADLERAKRAITRLNQSVEIRCDPNRTELTLRHVSAERERAREWLVDHSQFFKSGASMPVGDLEAFFTRHYVSHMMNEAVKAHRMAIAHLGLVAYNGKILRDPSQTADTLSLGRRGTHVVVRMGFVQAMFKLAERDSLILYRMESCDGPLRPRRLTGAVLVSASFRMDIVQEMSGWADPRRTVALYRQAVPIDRVLMTYLEPKL